jgi:hypothetical protein
MTADHERRIQRAHAIPIEHELARRAVHLKRQGKELVGPCPRCGGRDRFAVSVGRQIWNCRGCKPATVTGDVIGLVMWFDDVDFIQAVETLDGAAVPRPRSNKSEPRALERRSPRDRIWLDIWNGARDPVGTLVDVHLARRGGLILPPRCQDVRFHPRCPFGTDLVPAMIALVRNVVTNEPQAIHRTALDPSGRKVEIGGRDRMALGPIKDGAVKLTADEDVTIAIGIGEGIETTLSLHRLPEWGSPVWSLLNASGIANFPVLAGIETLVIAVDHDDAGENAALAVTERWLAVGREVLLFEATNPADDLNDVMKPGDA